MSALGEKELQALIAQFDQEEQRIRAQVGSGDMPVLAPPMRDPGDQVDAANEEVTERTDDAMLDHYRMQLADIGAARERIGGGRYGICTDCGERIPFPRLQAYPTVKRCTPCQRRHELLFACSEA
ncbi:TraR/DksA family transcriptional regulator [Cupriavidus necator]